MFLRTLGSGSGGNATLVSTSGAGEARLLVDAGLTMRELRHRLELAGVPQRGVHHVAVTHGHLDHCKSAGALAKRWDVPLTAAEEILEHPRLARATERRAFAPDRPFEVAGTRLGDGGFAASGLQATPVRIPHDAVPTVAYRLEHDGADGLRRCVILTDMGEPDEEVCRRLRGAHLLVLEFNHDEEMLADGPYRPALKRRVAGAGGHLSNAQAARVLERLVGPELHTLVLAHLSETNNTRELALEAAQQTLTRLGRDDVRVVVAEQDRIGPALRV